MALAEPGLLYRWFLRLRDAPSARPRRAYLLLRGLVFWGWRYHCPCCDWRLRAFTGKRGLLQTTADGYCPRCNGKARHRRDWLYLQSHTNLLTARLRLLEVAPRWALARRLQSMANIDYAGVDLVRHGPEVTRIGDVTALPLESDSFDALICIHVLEHVVDDRRAIAELFRVLRPGAWALITVPLRLDLPTHEDPSVTDPAERERQFGERSHVRFYGADLPERLRAVGFVVTLDPASEIDPATRSRHGLREDENVLHCLKPLAQPKE